MAEVVVSSLPLACLAVVIVVWTRDLKAEHDRAHELRKVRP